MSFSQILFRKIEGEEMDKKMAALTLVTLTVFAAVIGGLVLTTQATVTNSTTTDTTIATTDMTIPTMIDEGGFFMGDMGREGHGHGGHGRGMGGMGTIEVSSEYTANVNVILEADTDVQNLISEGYNVTAIKPIIGSVVEADGTVTTKAATAIAFLDNGTSGHATVNVDVENATVTRIVITTRTVIDKTSS
jgi:hypothetical protein